MRLKLLIASSNLHKVREFKALLKPLGDLDIYSLKDFPDYVAPFEDQENFEEIVKAKALDAATKMGMLAIADDSGLVVPAINGEPGIYSARYAGLEATDQDNRVKLLNRMKDLKDDQRCAYFVCSVCLALPNEVIKLVSAQCHGQILESPRGGNGFGYDPLFLKNDYGKTFAEMDETLKNRVSHRHKAFLKIVPYIKMQLEAYAAHH